MEVRRRSQKVRLWNVTYFDPHVAHLQRKTAQIVTRLFYCLLEWVMILPQELLSNPKVSNIVFEVIENGLNVRLVSVVRSQSISIRSILTSSQAYFRRLTPRRRPPNPSLRNNCSESDSPAKTKHIRYRKSHGVRWSSRGYFEFISRKRGHA